MDVIFKLIRTGNLEEIKAWIKDKNTNKNVLLYGETPLHYAICLENEEAAEIFVKNNFYIQNVNWNNNTPLHYAAAHGFTNLASDLIERGATINVENKHGKTSLRCAIDWRENFETTKKLLNEGASLLTNDNDGNDHLKLRSTENIILLLKHHVKLQKFVVCRKQLFLTSRVFLKFSNTFKFSFAK